MRQLNDLERAVLAHKVVDPDSWWNHVCTCGMFPNPEVVLAAKVSRWAPEFVNDRNRLGPDYKTAAQIAEIEAAEEARRLEQSTADTTAAREAKIAEMTEAVKKELGI